VTIIDDLLATLTPNLDAPVRGVRMGAFWTAVVLEDGRCGLVLGPTTPLSPVLFDHGADVVSGTLVTDPETVLRYVSQGASFRQIKRSNGMRLLTLAKEVL
jgi:uncharacterized protein (DUF4213/DUF364 family)